MPQQNKESEKIYIHGKEKERKALPDSKVPMKIDKNKFLKDLENIPPLRDLESEREEE